MNLDDTSRVLAKAAAFDNRTPSAAAVAAWAEALGDVELPDALAAVSRHYASTNEWIKPVHIHQIVAEIYRERRRAWQEERRAEFRALESTQAPPTRDRTADVQAMLARLRDKLPDTGREAIRPREVEWERQRRLRERPPPEPNPLYDPTAADRLAAIDREMGR